MGLSADWGRSFWLLAVAGNDEKLRPVVAAWSVFGGLRRHPKTDLPCLCFCVFQEATYVNTGGARTVDEGGRPGCGELKGRLDIVRALSGVDWGQVSARVSDRITGPPHHPAVFSL